MSDFNLDYKPISSKVQISQPTINIIDHNDNVEQNDKVVEQPNNIIEQPSINIIDHNENNTKIDNYTETEQPLFESKETQVETDDDTDETNDDNVETNNDTYNLDKDINQIFEQHKKDKINKFQPINNYKLDPIDHSQTVEQKNNDKIVEIKKPTYLLYTGIVLSIFNLFRLLNN